MPKTGAACPALGDISAHPRAARGLAAAGAMVAGAGLLLALVPATAALAGPVVCTTTLEAPVATAAPVEITRCGRVQTVPELVTRRFYSYTAPYERGVSLTNQITDFFGIAMGGGDGSRVMGLGFPDQTIVWDGLALQNTTSVLLEAQSSPCRCAPPTSAPATPAAWRIPPAMAAGWRPSSAPAASPCPRWIPMAALTEAPTKELSVAKRAAWCGASGDGPSRRDAGQRGV